MKIAVTAASGQLGSAIITNLQNVVNNDQIIGVARTPAKAGHPGIEVRPGDYTKPNELKAAFAGCTTVLLVSGMDNPDKRIEQHRNVINAARAAGAEKIVYTSVQGAEEGSNFSPIVASNRQTEKDVRESGLNWAIGRNGIYIEPDVEYIDHYKTTGEIANSAGNGKCAYTTRDELGYAYAKMLTEDRHNGHTYNLSGESLTQSQLADYLNLAFGANLVYRPMTVQAYLEERQNALGDFLGTVIAGIYQSIREGAFDTASDYEKAAGRPHQSWDDYFRKYTTE
jgi:NAD(P)H dehydrogenase (quinone)